MIVYLHGISGLIFQLKLVNCNGHRYIYSEVGRIHPEIISALSIHNKTIIA